MKRKTGQSPVPRAIFAEPADVVVAQPDRDDLRAATHRADAVLSRADSAFCFR
jgi:hypothetical protein